MNKVWIRCQKQRTKSQRLEKRIPVKQWCSKCGPRTSSNSITWEHGRNKNYPAPSPASRMEALEVGPVIWVWISPTEIVKRAHPEEALVYRVSRCGGRLDHELQAQEFNFKWGAWRRREAAGESSVCLPHPGTSESCFLFLKNVF